MSARSSPQVKYNPRYGRFCKRRFADIYRNMDEKKLKNWKCIEHSYKSSSHSESFGLLPYFLKYLPWLTIYCSSLSTNFFSIVLRNSASGMRVKLFRILWMTSSSGRTSLSGHASRSETTRNRTGWNLGCILNAPSLQCGATLATRDQDELYVDAHCCDGVSTIPQVMVISP